MISASLTRLGTAQVTRTYIYYSSVSGMGGDGSRFEKRVTFLRKKGEIDEDGGGAAAIYIPIQAVKEIREHRCVLFI